MNWRTGSCPRCAGGTLAVDVYHGAEIANCISCGYEVENKLPCQPITPPATIQYPLPDEMSPTQASIRMRGDTIEYLHSVGMDVRSTATLVGTDKRTVYRWLAGT